MSEDPKTAMTCFTDGLAEALSKEPGLPVLIRGKDGELRTLTTAVVTRLLGPNGEERLAMVLSEGEGDRDEEGGAAEPAEGLPN